MPLPRPLARSFVALLGLLAAPARAADSDALVTDERLFALASWAPVIIALLLLLAWVWADHGRPQAADVDDDDELFLAPSAAPDHADLDRRRRDADRG